MREIVHNIGAVTALSPQTITSSAVNGAIIDLLGFNSIAFGVTAGTLVDGSYAVTLGLAALGGPDRARTRPWVPLALAGKVALDALQAGKLTWDQWARHRAFCSWCLLAAGATLAMVPLVLPEARAALEQLRRRP